MPDRITRRIYPAWVRRYASVILFVLILGTMFLVVRRLERQSDQLRQQEQQQQESCQQRAKGRAAVRQLILDSRAQIAELQEADGVTPTDPQQVEQAVNDALPPLTCD